ncbi:MAG: glycogen/starch/alpha-glucan phosphorylase [Proteobacteria bacterium]|nr:glycogen/starch/alpha-glucan phosphorylase [Pseudomonadota bacterium]
MERDVEGLHKSLLNNLTYSLAKDMYSATTRDKFSSVVLSVRELLVEQWINTQQRYYDVNAKRVYYLSLEFLLGRLLRNYVLNLGLSDEYNKAVDILGLSYEDALEHEWDAGLGNGGLGRLAACFLDSLATLQYPGYGYGIRYEYGIFYQKIKDGFQIEVPDNWLRYGNPWEFPRPELLYPVRFYGKIEPITGGSGRFQMKWVGGDEVLAMAYDYPVPGFRNKTVNTLRLWAAKSTRDFNLEYFNSGDYIRAVQDKNSSEIISKVLYPSDQYAAGKELRLKQQYFFVSATLKDIIRRYKKYHQSYNEFPENVAVQLNDTHPSVAIPELMRIFVDDDGLDWDDAWKITLKTFGYTNHTVLPEALETWSEGLFGYLLPRHLQIVQEMDRRFLIQVSARFPDEPERKKRMSIITGDVERSVNMARLAIIGSHSVNGVSELHTDILKQSVFRDFNEMMPEKFKNVTNGITPRRWLLQSNPHLSGLITETIGDKWMTNLEELRNLEAFADDKEFCKEFRLIKEANKNELSDYLFKAYWLSFPPDYMLDCQTKRFHEYKRQLLNVLHVITMYNRIREGRVDKNLTPRTVLFSGKSAPGYFICKLIIKLIHNVSAVVDADPAARDMLRVVFVPNYDVSLAQRIMPAAELSEQISTAGYEASGTGNMKYTINGALTIGTLDGANVEIREEVGDENFFLFGLKTEELAAMRASYNPRQYYEENKELKQAIDQISGGYFSPDLPQLFQPIISSLFDRDQYFVLADYASYMECQERVDKAYRDKDRWTRMAVLNVARSGKFSSDRAIREYAETIWNIMPVPV